MDLFVEGIVTYHVVIEGVLAMTGQHQILKYLENHDIYPGFRQGFSLVEQDEHRHIAFGVRFLADACEREPRYRQLITDKIAELVPVASHDIRAARHRGPERLHELRLPLVGDLRIRVPGAEAPHGRGRRRGAPGGPADAGPDRPGACRGIAPAYRSGAKPILAR